MLRIPLTFAAMALLAAAGNVSANPPGPEAQTFDSNGTKISYFVQGTGEPVVLIHGWLSSAQINWELPGTSALLAQDHMVIALDMRGHGQSDKPTRDEDYGPQLVEDIVRLMDHLKVRKAHIVGYSMGGIVAVNFIVKHPDRVLSGTLGGMGWLKPGSVAQFGFAQLGRRDSAPNPAAVCGRSLATLAVTEDQIKSIHVPVAILVGEQDNLMKRLYIEPLERVRTDWPVVEIKDANHITCILRPQFKEEIAAWLKKNASP